MKKTTAKSVKRPKNRKYIDQLLVQIRAARFPAPKEEVLFHPTRKWRFDLAWPDFKIAVEYQGGIFSRLASHSSVTNMLRDQEKANEAVLHDWILITVNARTVISAQAINWIRRAFKLRRQND